MCNDPSRTIIAGCACGAYFSDCDFIDALLHITPKSAEGHKWIYIRGNSFVAGRDGKTFKKQLLIHGQPIRQWKEQQQRREK